MVILNCFEGTGIYRLGNLSASGKTYMGSIMQGYNAASMGSYCVITYNANAAPSVYIEFAQHKEYDVIFVDRLDLYLSDEFANTLNTLADRTLIVVDLKYDDLRLNIKGVARVTRTDNEVSLTDVSV